MLQVQICGLDFWVDRGEERFSFEILRGLDLLDRFAYALEYRPFGVQTRFHRDSWRVFALARDSLRRLLWLSCITSHIH